MAPPTTTRIPAEIDAVERARRGLRPMMRLGSAWYDVESQITAVTEKGLDPRQFILCTDDAHAATLLQDGHMDRVLRHAVDLGCDPVIALQMMTINTAQHFGLDVISAACRRALCRPCVNRQPRRIAADMVIANGRVLAEHGQWVADLPAYPTTDVSRGRSRSSRL